MKRISIYTLFVLLFLVFLFVTSCNAVYPKATEQKISEVVYGKNYKYNTKTKILNIKINGKMKYDCENAPWKDIEYPEHIVLDKGITNISNWGFGCKLGEDGDPLNFNDMIKTVVIPNTVENIDANAFWHCVNLEKVNIPNSVFTIGHDAFGECKRLKSITIPKNVKSIETASFSDCNSLKKVIIKNGVTRIEPYAFIKCNKLKKITIPKSVNNIGKEALGFKNYGIRIKDFTIKGYKGSAAEKYATENSFKFIKIN